VGDLRLQPVGDLSQPGGRGLVADRRPAPSAVRPDPEPRRDGEGLRGARARAVRGRGAGAAEQASAENAITSGLRRLLAVAENYPDLKASANFLALQEELTGTESKIAYARQYYNEQVRLLNTRIQSFPSSVIANAFGFDRREFFDIEDEARGPVEVNLGRGNGPAPPEA
jgi:LemA protein